eukprot:TRINITY_DN6046_c0_g1_i11.p1 TRINITY_DN6046_c0_g1~~TRINITY_DN6046_c0_g1_i11.p1  ORF type:complete len:493 (-),score=90.65 TRINITY_DN6046_c0_g1_i11:171-1649(-)
MCIRDRYMGALNLIRQNTTRPSIQNVNANRPCSKNKKSIKTSTLYQQHRQTTPILIPISKLHQQSKIKMEQRICAKSYKLTKKLGAGAFGEIFLGINIKTNEEFAVKLEHASTKHPQLFYEAKLYQYLLHDNTVADKGIPQVHYCACEGDYNIMVLDLLGQSLEDLFNLCNRKFSLKTVLMLADQMISRIEYVHSRHFLHRDIKPDNFLMGSGKKVHKVYIIDFGLAKRYIGKDGKHIPYRENKNLTGTARYASVNTHMGIEQARRDDLESLGYVMMYFLRGALPWQNLKASNKKDKYERIMEKKLSTPIDALCKGFPNEFGQYLTYCRNLRFEDKPDYNYLRNMLRDLFTKSGYEYDYIYDWTEILNEKKNEARIASTSVPVQSNANAIGIEMQVNNTLNATANNITQPRMREEEKINLEMKNPAKKVDTDRMQREPPLVKAGMNITRGSSGNNMQAFGTKPNTSNSGNAVQGLNMGGIMGPKIVTNPARK